MPITIKLLDITFHNNNDNNKDGKQLQPNSKIAFVKGGVLYKLTLQNAGSKASVTAGRKLHLSLKLATYQNLTK